MKKRPVSAYGLNDKSGRATMRLKRVGDERRNVVVIGETGAGKTSVLQDLLRDWATKEGGE